MRERVEHSPQKIIMLRHEALARKRKMHEAIWGDIGKYILPIYTDIHQDGTDIKYGKDIYDGTPTGAMNLFANGIYGNMVSQASKWVALRIRNQLIMERHEVKVWIQDAEEGIYAALNNSNFYKEILPYIRCGGSIGTAMMFPEEDKAKGKISFTHIHPGQVFIADDKFGDVDVMHREADMEIRKLVQRFGYENLPDNVQQMYNNDPFNEVKVIHSCAPRENRKKGKIDKKNKAWSSDYILKDASENDQMLLESGFDEFPYVSWRYASDGSTPYGWSPCFDALAEVKSLHAIARSILIASQKAAEPAVFAPSEMADTLDLSPQALNIYDDPTRRVYTLDDKARFDVGIERERQKQESIKELLQVNFFLLMSQTSSIKRQMTATEVDAIKSESAAVLSPMISRFAQEPLDTIIQRVLRIEMAAGRIPQPPQILLDTNPEIDIEFLGPLAQAGRRVFSTQGTTYWLEIAPRVQEMFPETKDIIKGDEIMRSVATHAGLDVRTIRPRDEVEAIRQRREEEIQQQQAQEQALMGTEALKNVGQAAGAMPEQALNQLLQEQGAGV